MMCEACRKQFGEYGIKYLSDMIRSYDSKGEVGIESLKKKFLCIIEGDCSNEIYDLQKKIKNLTEEVEILKGEKK